MLSPRNLSRRILLASIAAPAVVLTAVSLAWACVPQGTLNLNPTQGAAGSQVAASGSGFEAGATVEIRWESRTGTLLATATGPSFNVPITIPRSATGGTHYVSAAMVGEHAEHSATAASFEVTGPAPPGPPGTNPAPPSTVDPHEHGPSPRAKAVKRCKRKYSAKRGKTAAKKRRLAKKRKACLRKAKRLSNDEHHGSSFNFASLPLLG